MTNKKLTTAQVQAQAGAGGATLTGYVPRLGVPVDTVLPDIAFVVYGMPTPQGSKKLVGGGRLVESAADLKPWRNAIATQAKKSIMVLGSTWAGAIDEPVMVGVTFTFPHSGASLKRGDIFHDITPDLDKLQRAVGDALSPTPLAPSVGQNYPPNARARIRAEAAKTAKRWTVLADDSRIVSWYNPKKVYVGTTPDSLPHPGAVIEVWRMSRLVG